MLSMCQGKLGCGTRLSLRGICCTQRQALPNGSRVIMATRTRHLWTQIPRLRNAPTFVMQIRIDPMYKWLPIKNYFVSIKISPTNLVFELIIQKNFYSQTRLVELI